MSTVKKQGLGESSVIMGGLTRFQNKQNLNGEEIREMVQLLRAYESLCIQREDFAGAESVKNKIEQLLGQELLHKREKIAVKEKEQIEVVCKQGDEEIRRFQETWDRQIQALIEELKTAEEDMVAAQHRETEEAEARMRNEQPPKVKYSSHVLERRTYLGNLIKARNYREAEVVKVALRELESTEEQRWVERFQQRQRLRLEKLQRKQAGQLQALRVKLEAVFNEKIKERDRKFEILLKKNRKRRVDSAKPSRERIRSRNGILTESKLHPNISFI